MASTPESLYVTYVDVDRDLLKIWGQRNRVGATYIERQLMQLVPEFNRSPCPNPTQIHKGMFCFAKNTDDNYYRARVISRVQNDSVCVLFVDYGNRDIIKLSNIRIQEGNEGDVLAKMSEQVEEFYLARIAAPTLGWKKEIVSEIRRIICYEEFFYQIVTQVADHKVIEVQFRDEDFSDYLVTKQLATSLSLHAQKQMILSYCHLMQSDIKTEAFRDMPQRVVFSPAVPPLCVRTSLRQSNIASEEMMQVNYGKTNNPVNFSQPPHAAQGSSPRHSNSTMQQMNQNITRNSYFPSVNPPGNQQMHGNLNPLQPVNPVLNSLLNTPLNSLQAVKDGTDPFTGNNNIMQILVQQLKQYIDEGSAKNESKEENIPHHYLNNVLEVGGTYNVIISYIDDGPWSFSVQLLSSETELHKLMDELVLTELVPLKPPIILGHPCIASSALYGNLCRGVVVSISHTAVKVYFVDFGNTEDLPSSSIYELPPKFFKIRVLSQKFSLNGLQKVVYSDNIKRFFKEVVQDELLMLQVTSLEGDNLPTCELYLKDKNIKRILNEKIRELKISTQEDFPKVGETENIIVTWVVSPQKFFVQLRKRDEDLRALKKDLAEVEAKGQRLTYQQLSVGFKCICLYESDGNWYRAVITSVDSENAITVFYVDYGNTETVNISCLRRTTASGLVNKMGNQAIQCCLKGFENKPFDQELSNRLENLVLEKDLQMVVVSCEKELLCVQLLDNGKDVSSILLTSTSPKLETLETSQAWSSPFSVLSSCGNSFEKQRRPDAVEAHEKKDSSSFPLDRTRQRNISGRPLNNFPSFKSPVHSTPAKSKRRAEETWRNVKDNYWSEPKSGDQKSSKVRGVRQVRESDTWDNNNNSNYNSSFGGNNININAKSGGSKQERGGGDWGDGVRFERSRGFKQDKNRDGWNDRKDGNFGDKKKSDENRGGKERVHERKFGGGDGRRSDRSRGWEDRKFERNENMSFRKDRKYDDPSPRKPVRKEDVAPPGSKFEEKFIHIGSCENGIVTYYFSPHEFFVQLLAQEKDFKKMMIDIQAYYSDKYCLRDPVQAGDIVIAQFSLDKVLYRAEVLKPSPVTVRYVDYGNQEPVRPKSIWLVDKQFLNLPKQVIRCRLSNVEPIGTDWPPPGGAMDRFFEFSEYKCTFLSVEGDMYEISLEDVETGKDIAEELIAAGHVRRSAPKLDVPKVDYSLLPNQILRLYVSHVECSSKFYVILDPKSLEAIENELKAFADDKKNLIPLNEALIKPEMSCLSTNDDISWYRGNIVKIDGDKIVVWFCDRGDSVEVTADKVISLPDHLKVFQPQAVKCTLHGSSFIKSSNAEDEFKRAVEFKHHLVSIVSASGESLSVVLYNEDGQKCDFHNCDDFPQWIEPIGHLPIISQKLQVVPLHIESPHEIYIQRLGDSDELVSLSERLSSFYSEERIASDIEAEELEGTLVAAKSVFYETWYRGRLVSSSPDGLEVFYIDYGNREILPRENVKKLDPLFLSLNVFSKKLTLDVTFNEDRTQEINNKFMELCQGKFVLAYFVNVGGKLISEFTSGGQRITHMLKFTDLSVNEEDKFAEILSDEKSKVETQPASQEQEQGHPSSANIPEPDDLKVVVTHIDSPNLFWVYKESMSNELRQFQEKLQECCEVLPDKKNAQVDDVIGAVFSDKWYRARVTKVDGNNLTVQFIDYGNTFIVDLSSNTVKELTQELLRVPVFATPFALTGTWSEDSTSKFEEIILQNEEPVRVVVLEESDPVVVDLLQNGNGQSIAEILKERVRAEDEEGKDLCTVYISHSISPSDFYIRRVSRRDTFDELNKRLLDASNFESPSSVEVNEIYAVRLPDDEAWYRAKVEKIHEGAVGVSLIDYGDTSNVTEIKCLPSDLVGIPNLAENCSLIYGDNCDSWSEAALEKFTEFSNGRKLKMKVIVNRVKKPIVKLFEGSKNISEVLETLCENDGRSEVYVSHALSPTDFYIQYVNDEEWNLLAEKLERDNGGEDLEDTKPGTLCQARFVDDGRWYRAKILRNLDEGVEVFFIDFGNISVATELKKLPAEMEGIPPKAFRCRLNLPETNITESVQEEFIRLVVGGEQVFRALVIESRDVLTVSLKLGGRILEETLNMDIIPEESSSDKDVPNRGGRNRRKNLTGGSLSNETNEEKISVGGTEDFRSDDEKGNEGTAPSSFFNATGNELMEEESVEDASKGNVAETSTVDFSDRDLQNAEVPEGRKGQTKEKNAVWERRGEIEETLTGKDRNVTSDGETKWAVNAVGESNELGNMNKCKESKNDKMVPGTITHGEEPDDLSETSPAQYHKVRYSEKVVPGSISRGVSLEAMQSEHEETSSKMVSQSAPNTPKFVQRSGTNCFEKVDPDDRLVPGTISRGVSLQCNPTVDKFPPPTESFQGA